MKRKVKISIAILMLLAGIGIMIYPVVSSYISKKNQLVMVQYYSNNVDSMDKEVIKQEKEKAIEYNDSLSGAQIHDPFVPGSGFNIPGNYNDILNIDDGIMASIEIPKINVNIPIYHGTNDYVLAKGVGHIRETSLPIGGESSHSVICGHRGLPNAELFTNLDKVEINDEFYIHILDEVHVYVVDQIKIVEPEDTKDLLPIEGKDYVTLLTCTPYGINSHRLLIRGERNKDKEDALNAAKTDKENEVNKNVTVVDGGSVSKIIYIVLIAIIVLIGAVIVRKLKLKRKKLK